MSTITIESLYLNPGTRIQLLGNSQPLKWRQQGKNLQIVLPPNLADSEAYGLKLTPRPWQVVRE